MHRNNNPSLATMERFLISMLAMTNERTNKRRITLSSSIAIIQKKKRGGSTFEANRKSWGRDRGHLNMWRETQIKRERKMKKKCFVGMSNSLSLFISFIQPLRQFNEKNRLFQLGKLPNRFRGKFTFELLMRSREGRGSQRDGPLSMWSQGSSLTVSDET